LILAGDSSLHFVALRMTDICLLEEEVVSSTAANHLLLSPKFSKYLSFWAKRRTVYTVRWTSSPKAISYFLPDSIDNIYWFSKYDFYIWNQTNL